MRIVVEIEKMIIIILMITCVFIRNMLALIIMIVSMTTCAEATTRKCTYPPDLPSTHLPT